jgi:hypothetical protein
MRRFELPFIAASDALVAVGECDLLLSRWDELTPEDEGARWML